MVVVLFGSRSLLIRWGSFRHLMCLLLDIPRLYASISRPVLLYNGSVLVYNGSRLIYDGSLLIYNGAIF